MVSISITSILVNPIIACNRTSRCQLKNTLNLSSRKRTGQLTRSLRSSQPRPPAPITSTLQTSLKNWWVCTDGEKERERNNSNENVLVIMMWQEGGPGRWVQSPDERAATLESAASAHPSNDPPRLPRRFPSPYPPARRQQTPHWLYRFSSLSWWSLAHARKQAKSSREH